MHCSYFSHTERNRRDESRVIELKRNFSVISKRTEENILYVNDIYANALLIAEFMYSCVAIVETCNRETLR